MKVTLALLWRLVSQNMLAPEENDNRTVAQRMFVVLFMFVCFFICLFFVFVGLLVFVCLFVCFLIR
jgi:hypothetical protein